MNIQEALEILDEAPVPVLPMSEDLLEIIKLSKSKSRAALAKHILVTVKEGEFAARELLAISSFLTFLVKEVRGPTE